MSIMVGVGRGAQLGVLIKDAESLERLGKIQSVVIDKTGTLTEGRPEVVAVRALGDCQTEKLIAWSAAIEAPSEHPLAQAIVRKAKHESLEIPSGLEFKNEVGGGVRGNVDGNEMMIGNAEFLNQHGVRGLVEARNVADEFQLSGHTVVFIGINREVAGIMAIADPIKESTPEALARLHGLNINVVMLTGDAEATARTIARRLEIDEYHAAMSPESKRDFVARLRKQGYLVAMAGDGINDAPALAEADVGIAMGTGTGIAMESAGVTLVAGDLRGVATAAELSRATLRNIRQNLFFAFIYNAVGIPIAAGILYPYFGILLSPMLAAAAMSLSSVSVIGNALRLRSVRLESGQS
jgi:Cu+-exporting ATPase